jgi:hypothetical protein
MANFPAVKPTRRSFALGQYPTKIYRALSGKTIRRSFGNRPYGATLDLVFENVSEETMALLYSHYHEQLGDSIGFALSDEVMAGLSTSANATRQLKAGDPFLILQQLGIGSGAANSMLWFYSEAPQIESTFRSLSTVSVKLVAEFIQ